MASGSAATVDWSGGESKRQMWRESSEDRDAIFFCSFLKMFLSVSLSSRNGKRDAIFFGI